MPTTVRGSCPLDCPDACSWVVTVDDTGTATRLRGHPDHPFTRGGLCPKVNPWLRYASDPGRLTTPLRRVGAKGEGRFEPVSWDEALAEAADHITAARARWGGAAIWPFAGTGNVGFVQGGASPSGARLWRTLGASGHDITICSVSGHVGLAQTLGVSATFDPEEVGQAGAVVLWGTNTLVANRHFWPFVEQAQQAGAPLIVVDPIRTRTADRADLHLAPRPGTDGALALGLCRALVALGAADEQFLADRTSGWAAFAEVIEPWTPARTAEVTGVAEGEVLAAAEILATQGPMAIKLGQGMQRHAHGGQTARIVSCLPAITGAYGPAGAGLVYSTSGWYGLADPVADHEPPRRLAMTNLAENLLTLDDPPVGVLWVSGANPVVSNPDTSAVRQGLARDDLFTVAVELYQTETTTYADLVLPSTMQHEQVEINDSFAHLYLNWNEPAVEPPGECLPHTEIYRRLARRLGLSEPDLYLDDHALAAALIDTPAFREAGISVERLRADGSVRLPGTAQPFTPVATTFPTPSGRFEFVSATADELGYGIMPDYRAPIEVGHVLGPGTYALVASASEAHINSTFAGTAAVTERRGRPDVVVHPTDAARDGLVAGAMVRVSSERGSFEATLALDDGIRPGVVFTTKGWWAMGVNQVVAERDSDMGRGAVYHDTRVTISPA
ncbi:MAG: molybdopterin-dependent oxidoreductase [Actinomycetota bacterium]